MFAERVKHYIGAYLAQMGGADALIFTGGIGENSAEIRRRICHNLSFLGLDLDTEKNEKTVHGAEGHISTENSRLRAWVVPSNEELMIARDTFRCVKEIEK